MKKVLTKAEYHGIVTNVDAGIAHLVERHLAKVEVASSSLVARSIYRSPNKVACFFISPKSSDFWEEARGREL